MGPIIIDNYMSKRVQHQINPFSASRKISQVQKFFLENL